MLNHKHEGYTKVATLQHRIALPLALFYLIPGKIGYFCWDFDSNHSYWSKEQLCQFSCF